MVENYGSNILSFLKVNSSILFGSVTFTQGNGLLMPIQYVLVLNKSWTKENQMVCDGPFKMDLFIESPHTDCSKDISKTMMHKRTTPFHRISYFCYQLGAIVERSYNQVNLQLSVTVVKISPAPLQVLGSSPIWESLCPKIDLPVICMS